MKFGITDLKDNRQSRAAIGMASERIKVEHSIAGLKRYRILSDRLRTHFIDLYDDIRGGYAGLWSFYLANGLFCNGTTSLLNISDIKNYVIRLSKCF